MTRWRTPVPGVDVKLGKNAKKAAPGGGNAQPGKTVIDTTRSNIKHGKAADGGSSNPRQMDLRVRGQNR